MSSGRDSVGDLIPPDMLQVFTEERQGGRGKRGRRRAFTRAFKWLKRQRRKHRHRAAETRGDLLAPGSPVELPQSIHNAEHGSHLVQEFQENVFVEGNRPKYLLDLHTEAQQSLKLLQQEEDKNGVDYPDDQSMISTVTTRTEDSMAFSELRGFESESTAADSISMRSSVSSWSTRSGLKRQASTFRPLKPDKTREKTKSHRRHLKTVVGIPRHVQRELGLDRAAWITTNPLDDQLPNGAVVLPAMVSTVDGASTTSRQEGAQGHLRAIENLQAGLPTLEKPKSDTLLQWLMNNPSRTHDSENSGMDTLAVPLLTTSGNPSDNPLSAVMSISPQATYLSKIIPNAVLPPSVDVVELSRGQSRSSVRMVSKSSLVSASPASTRASSRVSSHRSTVRSNYSGWSRSDSSETLVSDSSTISSSSTPRVASRVSQVENTNRAGKTHVNGGTTDEDNSKKTGSAGAFTRNLSVMKKSKRPPAPPSRSYSLHDGKKTQNRSESPSCLTTQEFRNNRIVSPYSSPSSDNGSTIYMSKEIRPTQNILAELKMRENHKSPKSYTNGNSKLAEFRKTILSAKGLLNGKTHSPEVMALWSLLDIPDHPRVLAPPAPPPETWAHNQRTFELLCGPGPVNYARWAKKRGLKIEDVQQPKALANKHDKVKAPYMLQTVELKGKVSSGLIPSSSPPEHHPPMPIRGETKPPTPPPDTVPPAPAPATLWWQTKPPPDTVPLSPASAALWWQTNPPPDPVLPAPAPAAVWWQTESPPDTVDSALSPADQAIRHLTAWIPPHPLFPPPVPPVDPVFATPVAVQNDTVIPPPPPFSQSSILTMAQLPSDVPPPPPPHIPPPPPPQIPPPQVPPPTHIPPPPPQQVSPPQQVPPPAPPAPPPAPEKIPSPPQEARPSTHDILLTSTASNKPNVPPAPPLPTDVKKEVRLVTAEKEEKRSKSPTVPKEETSAPMVTQSLLQMVRLRSVKSNQSQAVNPDKPSHPTQKSGVSQDAPPKPVRRSLIITALPPDVEALSSKEPKTEDPSHNAHVNTTIASDTQQASAEPKTQSDSNAVENAQNTKLDPTYSLATGALVEPNNKTTPAEPAVEQPSTEPELKPKTFVEQIQPTASKPATLPSTTGPKDQSIITQPKTELNAQEPNNYSVKQTITIDIPSNPDTELPKTQASSPNLAVLSPKPPIISPSANPSMRLQDAIRLKTAAISSKDNQAKRFSLLSPPPVTGGNIVPSSPASTASFIFSKSPKKVIIETPTSPAVQADLRRTLVTELASVSDSSKSNDSHKMAIKVPPPVAMKPKAKGDSAAQNSAETESIDERGHETVQTAGQEVQTETFERTTNQ